MENMFENAKFGDKFRTRDGRKAIYFYQIETNKWHELIVEGEAIGFLYQDNGLAVGERLKTTEWPDVSADDIVSKWEEGEEDNDKLKKQLDILLSVADKLISGQLHTGNVAHDAPTKGLTIKNCVNNINNILKNKL